MWTNASVPPCEVTVVIPSYRSGETLRHCLAAVSKQETNRTHRIVVVHSGARDEPISGEIQLDFPAVQFSVCASRQLPGTARNWAARRVKSPWILFLDSDCVVGSNWLETMVRTAEQMPADVVGGSVANASIWSPWAWVMHILEFGKWLPGKGVRSLETFPSCNALYRCDAFLEAGGFLEDLFPSEEVVLNHVIASNGRRLVFHSGCSVRHIQCRTALRMLQYQFDHGAAYRRASDEYDLPPRFLSRLPTFAIVLTVVFGRFTLFFLRLLPKKPWLALLFALLTPIVWLQLGAWAIGYGRRSQAMKQTHPGTT